MASKNYDVTKFEHLLMKGYSKEEAEKYAASDEDNIPGPAGSERAANVTDPPATWGETQFDLGHGPAVDMKKLGKSTSDEEITTQDSSNDPVKPAPTVPGTDQEALAEEAAAVPDKKKSSKK